MRKLVFVLIAFIAAANFIRTFDNAEAISIFEEDFTEDYANAGGTSADLSGVDHGTQ
ncbi:MAG: hypothetical protein LBQ38_12650 [Spirochaetaceae bacterium]|jgi:hypothetical protein|nr:hypothetical protein [Spirochaetaceae bacterium]